MSDITEGFYQSNDGLKLFYRDYQSHANVEGDPILCLPGLTRNSLDFVDLATSLSKRRRIITTDLRGRGRSAYDPDPRHYHPGQYVADVWRLLDHLALSKVTVIGTSLGGLMAMLMVHERSSSVSAVVLNDIGPHIEPDGIKRVLAGVGTLPVIANWDEAVTQVKNTYAQAFPDWSDRHWQQYAHTSYRELSDGRYERRFDQSVITAAIEGMSGLQHDPWQLFDELLPTPLLVLRGEKSDIFSAATLQKMEQYKPDLTAVVVRNRGHVPNLNEPEAINAINSFLERN